MLENSIRLCFFSLGHSKITPGLRLLELLDVENLTGIDFPLEVTRSLLSLFTIMMFPHELSSDSRLIPFEVILNFRLLLGVLSTTTIVELQVMKWAAD